MKIYNKTHAVFLNFDNKVIRWINFCKSNIKFVKVQVFTIHLNDQSNILNQSIEENHTAEHT